jgi:hypothetical protein
MRPLAEVLAELNAQPASAEKWISAVKQGLLSHDEAMAARAEEILEEKRQSGTAITPLPDNWKDLLKPDREVGPRGGRYTRGLTKDGRPYRRYF